MCSWIQEFPVRQHSPSFPLKAELNFSGDWLQYLSRSRIRLARNNALPDAAGVTHFCAIGSIVKSPSQKTEALKLAKAVPNVKEVVNEIEIR